ncbi:MAG: hypothetical protein NTW49_04745 [Bacteroidia bacterium]|nr:hypothetical protein [Bacteroidia bacterium]
MMSTDQEDVFRNLKLVHYVAVCMLVLSALAVSIAFAMGAHVLVADKQTVYVLNTVVILVTVALIPSGYYFYNKYSKELSGKGTPEEKLAGYRKGVITRFVLFDLAGLSSLVIYALTNSQQSLYFILIIIVLFLINLPTETRFKTDF